jgi:hypothetical protein
VGFDITDQLLIRFFCISELLKKKYEHTETVNELFMDFKNAYGSGQSVGKYYKIFS